MQPSPHSAFLSRKQSKLYLRCFVIHVWFATQTIPKHGLQDGISPGISEYAGGCIPASSSSYKCAVLDECAGETWPRMSAKRPKMVDASVAGWVMGIWLHA